MAVDVLAIGAHPDDVEIGIGGLVHKLTRNGYTVGLIDLTRGEMSTRGTVEDRAVEGQQAAKILGAAFRETAGLPDSGVANTREQQLTLIPLIRKHRPRMVLAPLHGDRHPDHSAAHALVRDSVYFSGLARIKSNQEPYRPPYLYFFSPYWDDAVDQPMVIDITDDFDAKMAALRAHASQFHNPDYKGAQTYISSKKFWDSIEIRARYWGNRISRTYAEPICALRPVEVPLPPGLEEGR